LFVFTNYKERVTSTTKIVLFVVATTAKSAEKDQFLKVDCRTCNNYNNFGFTQLSFVLKKAQKKTRKVSQILDLDHTLYVSYYII